MSRGAFHRFGCDNFFCFLLDLNVCSWYLRLHFLQQVPSTCTGNESSEQFAGGQKILRHSTTPFCKKCVFFYQKHAHIRSKNHCEYTAFPCETAKTSTLNTCLLLPCMLSSNAADCTAQRWMANANQPQTVQNPTIRNAIWHWKLSCFRIKNMF